MPAWLNRRSPRSSSLELAGVLPRTTMLLAVLAVLVIWAVFVGTGLLGIDFGRHWDEPRLAVSVSEALRTGRFLPLFFVYPSIPYWLTLLPALPRFVAGAHGAMQCLASVDPAVPVSWIPCYEQWTQSAAAGFDPTPVIRQARVLFLFASSLAVPFTALLTWTWRGRAAEAVLAAAVVGLSWEAAYHARWTAPDGVLMAFSAATLWLVAQGVQRRSIGWLRIAAVSAACGAATKLNGGILLLPVLVAGFLQLRSRLPKGAVALQLLSLAGLFAAAFLLLCPGPMIEPLQFVVEILHEHRHYATGQPPYTVGAGPDHLWRLLVYLLGPFLSPRWWFGPILGATALIGVVAAWKRSRAVALPVSILVVAYLAIVSVQRVMFVRNALLMAPALASWCAWGVGAAAERLQSRYGRVVVPAVVGVVLLVNGGWLVSQASEIDEPSRPRHVLAASAVVAANPATLFYLSPRVTQAFSEQGRALGANVVNEPKKADVLVLWLAEVPVDAIPANRPNTFLFGLGAPEVNLNYYPSWLERDRIVAVRASTLVHLPGPRRSER